jgi:hypothetical protein
MASALGKTHFENKAGPVEAPPSMKRDADLREQADFDTMPRPLEITVPHHLQSAWGLNGDNKAQCTKGLRHGIQKEINVDIGILQKVANTYRFFAHTTAMLWDRLCQGYIKHKDKKLEIQTVTDPFTKPLLLRFSCHELPTSSSKIIDAIMMTIKYNDKENIVGTALIDGQPGAVFRDPNVEALKYLGSHAMTGVPSQDGKNDLTSIILQFLSPELLIAVARLFNGFAFTRECKASWSFRNSLTILTNTD